MTSVQRTQNMRAIRSRDTKPDMIVRRMMDDNKGHAGFQGQREQAHFRQATRRAGHGTERRIHFRSHSYFPHMTGPSSLKGASEPRSRSGTLPRIREKLSSTTTFSMFPPCSPIESFAADPHH
ncbi:hypothetical protein HFN62_23705 [Rhizobium leguminosarum]|nr:hypothetical protein [Rhizobium leguminosarum]